MTYTLTAMRKGLDAFETLKVTSHNYATDATVCIMEEAIQALREAIAIVERQPVRLIDCAMALQGNERIKLGSDLKAIAKAVLDAAGVNYVD